MGEFYHGEQLRKTSKNQIPKLNFTAEARRSQKKNQKLKSQFTTEPRRTQRKNEKVVCKKSQCSFVFLVSPCYLSYHPEQIRKHFSVFLCELCASVFLIIANLGYWFNKFQPDFDEKRHLFGLILNSYLYKCF